MEAETQRLFACWKSPSVLSVQTPATGTMNDVRIVETGEDRYILRIYRHSDVVRIKREHAVVQWLAEQGFPAVVPIPKPDGVTYHFDGGRLVTLLPYARGIQIFRDQLGPAEIATMGRCLGDLHAIMERCPVEGIPTAAFTLDRDKTLEEIDQFIRRIKAIELKSEVDENALHRLETRRSWLRRRSSDEVEIDQIDIQPIHGDYQETNVFFEHGQISAVIDWDKIYKAPAAWEVIRALDIMLRFVADKSRAFLDGYRERHALGEDELDMAARLYGLMRVYDLWLFREIYDEANERVRKFVHPGSFVPIEEQWLKLRPHIDWN